MITDLSWMLEDIVANVPKARHAVLLSADGLPRGATDGMAQKDVRTISAAMAGMQSLSRATSHFAGDGPDRQWNQTIIEFQHGWIFLISAGRGAFLAAAAQHDADIEDFTTRLHRVAPRLGAYLSPQGEASRA